MAKEKNPFEIDLSNLHEEWMMQPTVYQRYATEAANASEIVELEKAKLEQVKAEVELDIRANPSTYGLDKTTEQVIKAAVVMSKKVKKQTKSFISAKKERDILQGHVNTMEHKKRALEKLVDLHNASYFAVPVGDKPKKKKK